jgi:hypothetical protein
MMTMRASRMLAFALFAFASACAQRLIPADGSRPLPDGAYRFSEHPEGADPIVGTVKILGDSIAVETDRPCPTDYSRDGHGMTMRCLAYTLYIGNVTGRWTIAYATTKVMRVRHESCSDRQVSPTGQFVCKRYDVEYTSENVPVSGAVRLIPLDPPKPGGQ